MAAAFRRTFKSVIRWNFTSLRQLQASPAGSSTRRALTVCGCATGVALSVYLVRQTQRSGLNAHVVEAKDVEEKKSEKKQVIQTQRELRFLSFASVEYDGHIYMTPQDFLESVTEEAPRPRAGRRQVLQEEMDGFLYNTPPRGKGSTKLFRTLHNKGLISYTEYLFLVCVITKPKSGFHIAFNMFDTDGNKRVDKKEFLVLMYLYRETSGRAKQREIEAKKQQGNIWSMLRDPPKLQQLFTTPKAPSAGSQSWAHDMVTGAPMTDSTLTVHFFGRKGNDVLKYEDFHRFMDNLQTEVLELEFTEFAKGMPTITEGQFAKILLRYTILSYDAHAEYLHRLRERVPDTKGITFKEFKDFCQFLNSLDDFALAMHLYTYSDQPISQEDFKRAVKACTGQTLSTHLVNVVFQLFDSDGDGSLSQKEFISVMKDRLYRGFRASLMHQGRMDAFKSCVKTEMRSS